MTAIQNHLGSDIFCEVNQTIKSDSRIVKILFLPGVPQKVQVLKCRPLWSFLAKPKSTNLTYPVTSSNRFSGLRSLWLIGRKKTTLDDLKFHANLKTNL